MPFDVLCLPTPAEAEETKEAEGEGAEAEATPPVEPVLIGTIATHWTALAEGETKLTQVCQALIQPPAPEATKGKRAKKVKLPPPFTLSLTVTVELVA